MQNQDEQSTPTPFVIVGAERTGSNLLRGLLDSHPAAYVGGELFNARHIEQGHVPWLDAAGDDPELVTLRSSDPVSFLGRLFDIAAQQGFRAIGFKLMYQHGEKCEAARDYLASDTNLRVIHVTRRNLLRRYLSDQRARKTDVWHSPVDRGPAAVPPSLTLDFIECMADIAQLEAKQAEYAARFKDHDVLDLCYEDLAADPRATAARAVEFLGLEPHDDLKIRQRKTGTDRLREAITNYDELREQLSRCLRFFDE